MIKKYIVTLKSHWPKTVHCPGLYGFKTVFHYWAQLIRWKRDGYHVFIRKDQSPMTEKNTPMLKNLV